jgi:type IV secretory pathway VirJ component
MKKIFLYIIVIIFVNTTISSAQITRDSATIAPFGEVFIYKQTGTPKNLVIMISGDAGWKYGVVGFAETFAEKSNLVIGVDILRYYKDLRQRTDDCYRVATDFTTLATEIEKKYNFPDYRPPVIMGYSSGATLVYGVLAQARPGTFIGGISLGFCSDIDLPKMLCQTNGLSEKTDSTGKSYFLKPDARLGNPWVVLQGKLDNICNYSEVADFVSKTANAELITLPKVGHGFSKLNDFIPQWEDAFDKLVKTYEPSKIPSYNTDNVKNLPVIITNTKVQDKNTPVAILISGDGGWYSFEQSIADGLAEIGIPAIGLDSRKYFWNRRSPDETAGDIASLLSFYYNEWKRDKCLLLGYSLGAEIVPFIVNRLPEDLKSGIVLAVLLSPETTTDFEVHISNMLGMGNSKNTYQVLDEIKKLKPVPALCIFGQSEKSQVPELLKGTSVNINIIPGDHHYKFNVPLILQKIKNTKTF